MNKQSRAKTKRKVAAPASKAPQPPRAPSATLVARQVVEAVVEQVAAVFDPVERIP
jgi:hypothetical protein